MMSTNLTKTKNRELSKVNLSSLIETPSLNYHNSRKMRGFSACTLNVARIIKATIQSDF